MSRVDRIIAIDGIHTDYVDGKPGPLESRIETRKLEPRWGPMGMALLSDTRAGRLRIQGFAGNSAPDHVDLLHALPDLLRMRERRRDPRTIH